MKRRAVIILALFVPLLLLSCSTASLFKPTPTLTPLPSLTQIVTSTPSSSPTPRPTTPPVATPDLVSQYMKGLPEEPEGFEWKILPEQQMAVLIPDLWYFKQEEYPDLLLDAVYVTQEDIDTVGRYSTGMAVFVYEDFEDNEDAEQFALRLLVQQSNLATTNEVISAWDYPFDSFLIHHLEIRGEYPYETEENQHKIIHYTALACNNNVYWTVFETPENQWDEMIEKYGILIDYVAVFAD